LLFILEFKMETKRNVLVLFDFDGTLTKTDSFLYFLYYMKGSRAICKCLFVNFMVLLKYLFGSIPNWMAKEKIFKYFFAGEDYGDFSKKSADFAGRVLPLLIVEKGRQSLAWHLGHGHSIVIVSASFAEYLRPWGRSIGIDVLATEIEVDSNGKITGKFKMPNCYGAEKVRRIKEKYLLSNFHDIYGYGDSKGDLEMLNLANHSVYRWKEIKKSQK